MSAIQALCDPRPAIRLFLLTSLLCFFGISVARAATLPTGFAETRIATGLASPTAMTFAPDGRLFVAQQGGALRVIKNGALLAQPFLTVSVNSSGERGLLGVAFDPSFRYRQPDRSGLRQRGGVEAVGLITDCNGSALTI
jgi:glucose/sorbosone dehydrogenase